MDNDQKITAAIAAVMSHMKTEEMQRTQQHSRRHPAEDRRATAAPSTAMNIWGISGRQAQMQMRALMQMRAIT
ncbi:hypothetical protein ACFL0M_11810 [Thermodesulfobacteriota bacterium]